VEQVWGSAVVWVGLALLASLISWKAGLSVALIELIVGIAAGNTIHPEVTDWVSFLASLGAVVLTFLAGAELESAVIRRFWKQSLGLGLVSFAACFVTDLGTVIALGLLFTSFGPGFWLFLGATVRAVVILPKVVPPILRTLNVHSSEPEVRLVVLVLAVMAYLAVRGGSEGVLPAYLVGMVLADTFLANRELVRRLRATTFALLTPFYFLKAGSLVSLPAVLGSLGTVALFFLAKTGAKFVGLLPTGAAFGLGRRVNVYTTLLMSTGLTFGTISALYGLNHGIITQDQYSVLVVVIILTAIVPTMIAQAFFRPGQHDHDPLSVTKGGR